MYQRNMIKSGFAIWSSAVLEGDISDGDEAWDKILACDGTHIYVSDTENNRIQVFDTTGL